MKKIEKVITDCAKCRFCSEYTATKNNYTRAFICEFESEEEDCDEIEPFLILKTNSSGNSIMDIPDNCPLETYKDEN